MSAHDSTEGTRKRKQGNPDKQGKRPLVPGEIWDKGQVMEYMGISDTTLNAFVEAGLPKIIPCERREWYRTDEIIKAMDRLSAQNPKSTRSKGKK